MCGRLASGLVPQDMCNACCYKRLRRNHYETPQWKYFYNSGKTYQPSYNICPSEVALVLISGTHFKQNSRLLLPMVFGVIPEWSDIKEVKWNTINCRIETIEKSKLYGSLLRKGNRCAIVCTGFYEWQKKFKSKKPYFIHGEQPDGVVVNDPKTWNLKFTPEEGFLGFKPLKLAGLFEIKSDGKLEEATLSFTIITKEASSQMSWLHERVPAVLDTAEKLDAWLNHEEVDSVHALGYLMHHYNFIYFSVSSLVNKNNSKEFSCIKYEEPLESSAGNFKNSGAFLKNWLQRGQKRQISDTLENTSEKVKKEDG